MKYIYPILLLLALAISYKIYSPYYEGRKQADLQFEKGYVVLEGSHQGFDKEFGVPMVNDPFLIPFGLSCWVSKPTDYDKIVSARNAQIKSRIKCGDIPQNSLKEFEKVINDPSKIPEDWVRQQYKLTEKLKRHITGRFTWEAGRIKGFIVGEELELYQSKSIDGNNFDEYFTIAMPPKNKAIGILFMSWSDKEKFKTSYTLTDTIGGIILNRVTTDQKLEL
jgi:hypothetical protein